MKMRYQTHGQRPPGTGATVFLTLLALAAPLPDLAAQDDLTDKQQQAVKKQYETKCAKCHELHEPGKYTSAEWTEWFAKMARKSRLTRDQVDRFSKYADYLRKQTNAPPAQ